MPVEELDTPSMQLLLDVIRSDDFKQRVAALGGYDTADTGTLSS